MSGHNGPDSFVSLYSWQQECLKAWDKNDRRGIVHVATGAGKTVMALEAIRRFRLEHGNARVRIVVPTIALAQQWQSSLLKTAESGMDCPGFFGGGKREDFNRPIMIYVINSARDHLTDHMERSFSLGQPSLLICDECHHYQSKENRKIFDYCLPSFYRKEDFACLGLSATPFGTANDEVLIRALGPEIYSYGFEKAAADGIVSPFTVLQTASAFYPDERQRYEEISQELIILWSRLIKKYPWLKEIKGNTFFRELKRLAGEAEMNPSDPAVAFLLKTWERKEVSNQARTRLQCALGILQSLPVGTRTIIFCERISQAEDMLTLLRRTAVSSGVIYHSKMNTEARRRSLEAFRWKQAYVLIACRALDEGIDVPDAEVAIVLSSTSVTRQRIQRLGRILRKAPGKTAACLYYIYLPESTDDRVYLPGFSDVPCASLRYDPEDKSFSSELYEYAARKVLEEEKDLNEAQRQELRRCLLEGLPRADYLLGRDELQRKKGDSIHDRNYWKAMRRINRLFIDKPAGDAV